MIGEQTIVEARKYGQGGGEIMMQIILSAFS